MSPPTTDRRTALKALYLAALAGAASRTAAVAGQPAGKPATAGAPGAKASPPSPLFRISLAQWSLHRALQQGTLDPFDFPKVARHDYGIDAVEYVNTFYKDKHDGASIADLKKRCADNGVVSVLIMCDGEGALGDPDDAKRAQAVGNHRKWLDAAKALGCHSIRVNARSEGAFDEQQRLAADGLRRLCEIADPLGLNVIVENHGGLSSNGEWLVGVMKLVDHPRVGTLPDFGNFDPKVYDRYKGVAEMMPYARGVSAKSYDFDPVTGDHTTFDYRRMLGIVLKAGYRGRIGIEYEGGKISEPDGIRATKKLLEKIRDEFTSQHKFS